MTDDASAVDPDEAPARDNPVPEGSGETPGRHHDQRRRLTLDEYYQAWLANHAYDCCRPLAGYLTEAMVKKLDAHHHRLAADDPALDMTPLDIEVKAIAHVKSVHRHYFDDFGL